MAGGAITAAPAGLAASISGVALASAAAGGGAGLTILGIMTTTKIKAAVIGAIAVTGVATPMVLQHQEKVRLREENRSLRQRIVQLDEINAEREQRLGTLASDARLSQDQMRDLMRLRAEIGVLRRQTNDLARAQAEIRRLQSAVGATGKEGRNLEAAAIEAEENKRAGITRLNFARNWMAAFFVYAEHNNLQVPETFEQARPFLQEQSARSEGNPGAQPGAALELTPDHFEIVYRGVLSNISNPATTIVIREKEAWSNPNGKVARTYGFADGHTEIYSAPDGNFEPWEKQRTAVPQVTNSGASAQ
jgi:hypothetical protein